MSNEQGKGGIAVQLDAGDSVDKAYKLLNGFSAESKKAIQRALARASTSAKALGAKEVSKDYNVQSSVFKKYTGTKGHVNVTGLGAESSVEYAGFHIPLTRLGAKFDKDGKVSFQVMRSSARTTLNHAFVAQMASGHIGVFERYIPKKRKIHELLAPATPQMMSANEGLRERMGEKFVETFNKRLDHEVTRILNGWGTK